MSVDKAKILNALKLIKEAFVTKVEKFVDEKLVDGVTIIRYDAEDLAVGVPVMVVTADGAIAIPDGDYTTADGDTFTTAGGVVTVATLVAPADEAAPAPAAAMNDAQAKSIIESIIKESRFVTEDVLTEKVSELTTIKENFATHKTDSEKTITDLTAKYDALVLKFGEAIELIEKIAELPSASPTDKKTTFDMKAHKKAFKEDLDKITAEN